MMKYKEQITLFLDKLRRMNINIQEEDLLPEKLWFIKEYRDLVNSLIKDDDLSKYNTKRSIINHFTSLLKDLSKPSGEEEIVKNLSELRERLSWKRPYTVFVPIKGLDISAYPFKLGEHMKIIEFNKSVLEKISGFRNSTVGNIQGFNNNSNNIFSLKNTLGEEVSSALEPVCLEVRIETGEAARAVELAVKSGNLMVNYFRYIDYLTYNWNEEALNVRLPGYGPSTEILQVLLLDDDIPNFWERDNLDKIHFKINPETISSMNSFGLDKFIYLLNSLLTSDLTEMHQAIIRALTSFGESRVDMDDVSRFLKLMQSLETLLTTFNQELHTLTLSEKMAFILGDNMSERIEMQNYFNILLDLRNEIIQHGSTALQLVNLYDLEYYTSGLIRKFLTEDPWFLLRDKNELYGKFNSIKYA